MAAGICACGRAFAPMVKNVICLDATVPMLQAGAAAWTNIKRNVTNIEDIIWDLRKLLIMQ